MLGILPMYLYSFIAFVHIDKTWLIQIANHNSMTRSGVELINTYKGNAKLCHEVGGFYFLIFIIYNTNNISLIT